MSFSRLSLTPCGAVLMTACVGAESLSISQQAASDSTVAYVGTEVLQNPQTPAAAQEMVTAGHVQPRIKPRSMTIVPAYRPGDQPSLIDASAQQPIKTKPMYWKAHIVTEGTTASNLTHRVCSETEDIRQSSDLDAPYSLIVGQAIILPRSTC